MEKNFWCPDCKRPSLEVEDYGEGSYVVLICALCGKSFSPNPFGSFDPVSGTCSVCNAGRLREMKDGSRECVKCKSYFDQDGEIVDKSPDEMFSVSDKSKKVKRATTSFQEDHAVAIPSPS